MNIGKIKKLQSQFGFKQMQSIIDSGQVWFMPEPKQTEAKRLLDIGACMFPTIMQPNGLGGHWAARQMMKPGERGSYQNSVNFYTNLIKRK